jgi:hypothetical protein
MFPIFKKITGGSASGSVVSTNQQLNTNLDKSSFCSLQRHLQDRGFAYDLSESQIGVQANRRCFDETRRFITQLMLPGIENNQFVYCSDIQAPPCTLQELNSLLQFGPTLLFGEGLAQPGTKYIGPHAVAVLALIEDFIDTEPQLLLYDGDDTIANRQTMFQYLEQMYGGFNPEELTSQMLREAELDYLFFRLEPAMSFMANYAPRWCNHHLLPMDAQVGSDSSGWGACLQYLQPDQASAFLAYQTEQQIQTRPLVPITRVDINLS